MTNIIIDNIEIELTKKNIKNIRLSVHPPNGQVKISVPHRLTDESIRSFILSKLSWIKKQQLRFKPWNIYLVKTFIISEKDIY